MQIILTNNQFNFIVEAEREFIGRGVEHDVYTTRFTPNYLLKQKLESGDVVVKKGAPEFVKFYVEEFKKFPDIFPIVYKVGINKNLSRKNAFIFLENVDNRKFNAEYEKILNVVNQGLKKNGLKPIESKWTLNFSLMQIESELTPPQLKFKLLIDEYVEEYGTDEEQKFYQELKNLINKIYDLSESGKLSTQFVVGPDLHHGNFGITKDGKIKCLDF